MGSGRIARRLRTLLAGAALVLAWSAGTALPAAAHAGLATSNPVADAVLASAPAAVRLRFDEAVTPVTSGFALYDSRGPYTLEGRPAPVVVGAIDSVVTAELPSPLPPGSYLLSWRVVSADSHPVSGVLPFVVGRPSATAPTAPVADDSLGSGVGSLYLALQVLGYLGLFTAVGLRVFEALALRRSTSADRASARVLRSAAAVAVVSAVLLAPLTVLRERGGRLAELLSTAPWREAGGTPAALSLGLVAVGLGLLVGAVRLPPRASLTVGLLGALMALSSVLTTGHTRTVRPAWLAAGADLVHVTAAAVWLGGLVGLGLHLGRTRRLRLEPVGAAAVVARFSSLAGLTVGLLGASGVVLATLLPGSWAALLRSSYGHALAAKLALVAVLGVLAVWNRFGLVPAVQRRPDLGTRWKRLRSAVVDECAVVLVALAVTGLLTNLDPGGAGPGTGTNKADRTAAQTAAGATRRAELGGGSLQGRMLPATVGSNTFDFTLRGGDGAPLASSSLPEVDASLPAARLGPLHAKVSRLPGTAHYRAELPLPAAGDWRLLVSVRTGTYDEPTATLTVAVTG